MPASQQVQECFAGDAQEDDDLSGPVSLSHTTVFKATHQTPDAHATIMTVLGVAWAINKPSLYIASKDDGMWMGTVWRVMHNNEGKQHLQSADGSVPWR
jgi:hypothetical protein